MVHTHTPLVLISGVNGFAATEIALEFLKAGYRVRGTVRSPAKAAAWLALPAFVDYAASGQLEAAIVEDILVEDAFDNALKDVEYFLHTIGQLPRWGEGVKQDMEKDILIPNINGTISALKGATKHPAVKKVVVLGSITGAADFSKTDHDKIIDETCWNPHDYEYGKTATHPFLTYITSKKLAEEAAWKYVADNKPHFALITTLPGYIYGPSHGHDPFGIHRSTQQWLAGPLFRPDWNFGLATVGGPVAIDLRDVALAHVRAIERDEANGKRLLLAKSHPTLKFPSDFVPLFARHFPEHAARLARVPDGLINVPQFEVDPSKSEEALGMKFRDLEEVVLDTARWLIESGAGEQWAVRPAGVY